LSKLGEGYRKDRNMVSICNSDPQIMRMCNHWIITLANPERPVRYRFQYHKDQDLEKLTKFWGELLDVSPDEVKGRLKSNSGNLKGRKWKSEYGVLTVRVCDTYFRARLQAWMDFIKESWL
jgi:hypothetical protein